MYQYIDELVQLTILIHMNLDYLLYDYLLRATLKQHHSLDAGIPSRAPEFTACVKADGQKTIVQFHDLVKGARTRFLHSPRKGTLNSNMPKKYQNKNINKNTCWSHLIAVTCTVDICGSYLPLWPHSLVHLLQSKYLPCVQFMSTPNNDGDSVAGTHNSGQAKPGHVQRLDTWSTTPKSWPPGHWAGKKTELIGCLICCFSMPPGPGFQLLQIPPFLVRRSHRWGRALMQYTWVWWNARVLLVTKSLAVYALMIGIMHIYTDCNLYR